MLVQSPARPVCRQCQLHQQIRRASLIRRPKRPYTFTQMVTLSDGSTFLHRTTSPEPVYKSTKDTKNSALWNPSSQKLLNIEEDEAGRLKNFRRRFGRGFDVDTMEAEQAQDGEEAVGTETKGESLLDLISGFGQEEQKKGKAAEEAVGAEKSGKGKSGQK